MTVLRRGWRSVLARSAISSVIAMYYVRQQKGGRRSLRRLLRTQRESYVRAVLAASGLKPTTKKHAGEITKLRRSALDTWRKQVRRIAGQGIRAFTDAAHDQLQLFEAPYSVRVP